MLGETKVHITLLHGILPRHHWAIFKASEYFRGFPQALLASETRDMRREGVGFMYRYYENVGVDGARDGCLVPKRCHLKVSFDYLFSFFFLSFPAAFNASSLLLFSSFISSNCHSLSSPSSPSHSHIQSRDLLSKIYSTPCVCMPFASLLVGHEAHTALRSLT